MDVYRYNLSVVVDVRATDEDEAEESAFEMQRLVHAAFAEQGYWVQSVTSELSARVDDECEAVA